MTVGEAVRTRAWHIDALRSAEERLERRALDAGRVHAALLRDVLVIHREHLAAGLELSTEPLQRWVLEAVPREVEQRRKDRAEARRVSWRRREDGLADVTLFGVPSPLAQTVLQRIRAGSQPVSIFDDRTADQRRLDAAVDLLLGRADHVCDAACPSTCAGARGTAEGCGCRPGTAVPCGRRCWCTCPWAPPWAGPTRSPTSGR